MNTLRVQLEAKEKALEDAQTEAHLATSRLGNTEAIERRQQRIDKLTAEVGRGPPMYKISRYQSDGTSSLLQVILKHCDHEYICCKFWFDSPIM